MHRILIADDERVTREYLKFIIRDCGFEFTVHEVSDGDEAVRAASTYRPAVIFMDLKMPGMDGLEAIRTILKEDWFVHIYVLTAHDDFKYVQQALRLGVVDYFLKPLVPEKAAEILGAELQRLRHLEKNGESAIGICTEKTSDCFEETNLKEMLTNLVENRYQEHLSLGEAASEAGYSKYYFSRRFKEIFEENFSNYLNRHRIEKAAVLVRETNQKFSNIAREVGIHNYSYFTRLFKRYAGMLPREMRCKERKGNKVL
jgi:YesN/AraC family two-component response regulator